jgi:uncharacterized protein YutE (UPF0331/DUF86 family)
VGGNHQEDLRLLRSIADHTAVLRREAGASQERRQDPIWLRGVKYTFVTAIEACIDGAQHICAAEGWRPPAGNGDAVRLLGKHGVLTTGLAVSVRKAAGFRNVLVHDYIEVDDSIVVDRLKSLDGHHHGPSGSYLLEQRDPADRLISVCLAIIMNR